MDIEELKRLHAGGTEMPYKHWAIFMDKWADAFPAIVAKLEAAQRLRDALLRVRAWDVTGEFPDEVKLIDAAIAAFDKDAAMIAAKAE